MADGYRMSEEMDNETQLKRDIEIDRQKSKNAKKLAADAEKELKKLEKIRNDGSKKRSAEEKKRLDEEIEAKKKALEEAASHQKTYQAELIQLQEEKDKQRRGKDRLAVLDQKAQLHEAMEDFGEDLGKSAASKIKDILADLQNTLDTTMNNFLETQEKIAYNLNGSTYNLEGVVDDLTKALGSSGIVKQEDVYKNLQTLVEEGIVENVEQRAYLKTLSDDLGMNFNLQSKSLNRLILLQGEDMTSNRMAIQASLKTFLNQNYQTSQYIKDGFESVSDALLQAQSLMSANSAMQVEAEVQKWMGALSSAGMSTETINKLAEALGQLGSGNVSALNGTDMQRLLIMGANEVGKSYTDILLGGLTEDSIDAIMSGVVKYMTNVIGTSDNNVVMSELARVFGVTVSDVVAAKNSDLVTIMTKTLSDNINTALLNNFNSYQYGTKYLENALSNFMYSWGTGIASNETEYTIYKATQLASNIAEFVISGTKLETAPLGVGASITLSDVIKAIPMVTATIELVAGGTLGNIFSNFNGSASSIFSMLSGNSGNAKSVGDIFAGLGTGDKSSSVMLNTDNTDISRTAKNSSQEQSEELMVDQEEQRTTTEIYDLMDDNFKSLGEDVTTIKDQLDLSKITGNEETSIASMIKSIKNKLDSGLSVSLPSGSGSSGTGETDEEGGTKVTNTSVQETDLSFLDKQMVASAVNIQNIYNLLLREYNGTQRALIDVGYDSGKTISSYSDWTSSLTWAQDPSKLAGGTR